MSKKQELSKKREPEGARDERVYRAAERLRELRASGVGPSEILGGPAGASFACGDCEGTPTSRRPPSPSYTPRKAKAGARALVVLSVTRRKLLVT